MKVRKKSNVLKQNISFKKKKTKVIQIFLKDRFSLNCLFFFFPVQVCFKLFLSHIIRYFFNYFRSILFFPFSSCLLIQLIEENHYIHNLSLVVTINSRSRIIRMMMIRARLLQHK